MCVASGSSARQWCGITFVSSDSVEARRSDSVEARRSARGMAGAPRDGDPSRLWHILAASASFLTTTDARRIEGGAKALAAAIKLRNTAVRMISLRPAGAVGSRRAKWRGRESGVARGDRAAAAWILNASCARARAAARPISNWVVPAEHASLSFCSNARSIEGAFQKMCRGAAARLQLQPTARQRVGRGCVDFFCVTSPMGRLRTSLGVVLREV